MIYMKGFPESPMCGFSALAVKVFQQYGKLALISRLQAVLFRMQVVLSSMLLISGVPTCGRDILGDLKLKESVKAHT